MKIIKKIFKILIKFFFYKRINLFLEKHNYLIIFRYGNAIGDHICLTGIISKIYNKNLKIIIFSNYTEFFLHNPKVYKTFNLKKKINRIIFLKLLGIFEGERIKSYRSKINDTTEEFFMKFFPKDIHFGLSHASHFNIEMNKNIFKNEIFFSKKEIEYYDKKFDLPNKFAVIHSEAKQSLTSNKNWGPKRIQNVVDNLKNIKWIQVGKKGEYELKNTFKNYDNISLRELGYILSKSEFLVSMEGMFNHYASAFNKKNFLIHLGFMTMESIYYPNNLVIHKNFDLKCYPCFLFKCKNHLELCENELTSEYAVKFIKNELMIN